MMALILYRLSERTKYWPAAFNPTPGSVVIDVVNGRPVFQGLGLAAYIKKQCISPICCLLFGGRPAAIFGAVWAVIVDPIYRVFFGRSIAHIGIEAFKDMPSVANENTSPAIAGELLVFCVCAPGDHVSPNAMLGCAVHSMRQYSASSNLSLKAAARQGIPGSYVCAPENLIVPTFTFAKPEHAPSAVFGDRRNDRQSAKNHSFEASVFLGKIYWCKMYLSHIGTRFINVVRGLVVRATSTPHSTINAPALEVFA